MPNCVSIHKAPPRQHRNAERDPEQDRGQHHAHREHHCRAVVGALDAVLHAAHAFRLDFARIRADVQVVPVHALRVDRQHADQRDPACAQQQVDDEGGRQDQRGALGVHVDHPEQLGPAVDEAWRPVEHDAVEQLGQLQHCEHGDAGDQQLDLPGGRGVARQPQGRCLVLFVRCGHCMGPHCQRAG
jgi:hypothetical protein